MVQFGVHAAQAVAQAVHGAQALLKGHGPLHGRAHHVQPGLAVAAVLRGAFDVVPGALQSVQRDAVGWRVEGGCHEGFHAMGDGVHARGGGQGRGQTQGQLGVANGGLGHQIPRVEAQLAAVVHDHDGAARHLAAGAGGGRHGDQRRGLRGDLGRAAFDGRVGFQGAWVGGHDGQALGQVDAGATAHGDQSVALRLLPHLVRGAHGSLSWVGWRLVEDGDGPVLQGVQRLLQHARAPTTGVCHDQWALDADPLALRGQQADGAELELDLGEVEDGGHGFFLGEWVERRQRTL